MDKIYHVYGISDCPACLRSCADLMDRDLEYVFHNCDFSKSFRNEIRDKLHWPTFPIIIVTMSEETIVIGGSEQLKDHLSAL